VVAELPDDPFDPSFDAIVERPLPGRAWVRRLQPWVEWFGVRRVVAVAVTVVALVGGGWWLLRSPAPPTEAGLPYAATTTTASAPTSVASRAPTTTATTPADLVVHVAGSVARPGVYQLPGGSRADAAVAAAGGPVADADLDALNLAAPLTDGERVYVPAAGEVVAPALGGSSAAAPTTVRGPVDINRATVEQLDDLPGIGPATAQAIVAHREANGPFASVDQLEDVRGIGPAKLDAIRDLVTV
jgi:competence protein ComEA